MGPFPVYIDKTVNAILVLAVVGILSMLVGGGWLIYWLFTHVAITLV